MTKFQPSTLTIDGTVNLLGQYVLSVGADPTSDLVDSQTKGQLILKFPFAVFKSLKKSTIFL